MSAPTAVKALIYKVNSLNIINNPRWLSYSMVMITDDKEVCTS